MCYRFALQFNIIALCFQVQPKGFPFNILAFFYTYEELFLLLKTKHTKNPHKSNTFEINTTLHLYYDFVKLYFFYIY